jgi:MFS family permease
MQLAVKAENRAQETVTLREAPTIDKRGMYGAVIVAGLGYFVDTYDLALFSVLRVQSLRDLGYSAQEILEKGTLLLNVQMIGMLLGGFFWGSLSDRFGRMKILYASIAVYSLATFATAYVASFEGYALWRFIAGLGMAGEIGVGITLVSELLPQGSRGIGTTLVASLGILGVAVVGVVAEYFTWRTNYIIGGLLGFLLLTLRMSTHESPLFKSCAGRSEVKRGRLRDIFLRPDCALRYVACIAVGLPIWFVISILVTLGPEVSAALGVTEPVKVSTLFAIGATACTVGDLIAGLLSQWVRSRKRAIGVFLLISTIGCTMLLMLPLRTAAQYYAMVSTLYFFIGYWCVLITTSAEQFGTNVRATAATSIPNVIRGTTVPITLAFLGLGSVMGAYGALIIIALVTFALAFLGLSFLRESFSQDMEFTE